MTLLAMEAAATVAILLLALSAPRIGSAFFRKIETTFGRLARRKRLAVLVVTATAFFGRLLLLPLLPIPTPTVHDEFSYLLAAQTFASGRLTNPAHPMWEHFETFHVDQLPTYMSMYPPMQGLALATGAKIFGHPWFGVLFSVSLMCGAICWALQGWLPSSWALLGGLIAVMRLATFSYWSNSYWGGAIAATGGALVLGAWPRLVKRQKSWDIATVLILGLGLAILANNRPYEGMLISAPAVLGVGFALLKRLSRGQFLKAMLPLCLILLATFAGMAYYNQQVFGSPLTMPYAVNRATYAVTPYFPFQDMRPEPVYRHKVIRDFYVKSELPDYQEARTLDGFLIRTGAKTATIALFYFGPVLLLPLLLLPLVLRDRRVRPLFFISVLILVGVMAELWLFPHYMAPALTALYVLLLQSLRHLRFWSPGGRPVGLFLARAIPTVCVGMIVMAVVFPPPPNPAGFWVPTWYAPNPGSPARATMLSKLAANEAQQLAIVRYQPNHNLYDEWVYNDADIDGSKIVWAREMTPDKDKQLLAYFPNRQVWLIEPDVKPPRVTPYPISGLVAEGKTRESNLR
jgi:hypothetical protein